MTGQQPRVIFLGMLGRFSLIPLTALLAAKIEIAAVVVPGANSGSREAVEPILPPVQHSILPMVAPFVQRTIVQVGWEHHVPVWQLHNPRAPEAQQWLADLRVDLAVVACFPFRIPRSLLATPSLGFVNLHPSLLPAHRGPEPLFWSFRRGDESLGITLHLMDQGLDTGDIVGQQSVPIWDGINGLAAETRCAQAGADLLVAALRGIDEHGLPHHPQPAGPAPEPLPSADDWRLDPTWSARHAFRFMRGTAHWNQPYSYFDGDRFVLAGTAVSFDSDGSLEHLIVEGDDGLHLQFQPGVLHALPSGRHAA